MSSEVVVALCPAADERKAIGARSLKIEREASAVGSLKIERKASVMGSEQ